MRETVQEECGTPYLRIKQHRGLKRVHTFISGGYWLRYVSRKAGCAGIP